MSYSALSDLFEYLCYGSTAIRNIFTLTARGSTSLRLQKSESVDPRAVNVNPYAAVTEYIRFKQISDQ